LSLVDRLQTGLGHRYRIQRELGRGGMATVYLAEDLKHGSRVALKVLRPEIGAALGGDRFLLEIKTSATLQHPHILGLLDSGEIPADDAGGPALLFYTMPYVAGESLRDRLDRERQLPLDHAITIAREVADALSYAHTQNVVHRDIKPENILLSGGHAMVADFGIARALDSAGGEKLTETGLALGTPYYMSPEQATGDFLDGRADQYALGCVLYEMLAGTPPFQGSTGQSIMARHAVDPVPSLRTVRATIPAGVERAITRSLAKCSADRFATTPEFAEALTQAAAGPLTIGTSTATSPSRGRHHRRWRRVGRAVLFALVAIGLITTVWAVSTKNGAGFSAAGGSIRSLAVAPFGNLTGDPTQVYLAQGVTDQLITGLAQIGALKVIRLRDETADLAVAKDRGIDIDVVLGGSLQRMGDDVRITAQINSATTGQAIWARSYTGELRNILNLQDSVVRAVADTLRVSLSSGDSTRLGATQRQVNPDAYQAYLRGAYFLGKVSGADFRKAIGYFQQAIDAEPFYAAAYVGLANCYSELGYYALGTPEETFPKSRAAALKALEMDPKSATAYSALARVQMLYSWEFAAADRNHRRATELEPRATGPHGVHGAYNFFLAVMNRPDEAIAEARLAVELDPLSLLTQAAAARPYYNARRYPEAITQAKRALEIDSTFSRAHYWLGMSYEQTGRLPEAIQEFKETIKQAGPIPVYSAALGHAHAIAGQRAEAHRILAELEVRAKREYISPVDIAMIYSGLGEQDRAFEWLERGFAGRAYALVFLPTDPRFDRLRSDKRYAALMRRVGLPTS
jgi:eukaryotic-like serine/threonine-protein kinase